MDSLRSPTTAPQAVPILLAVTLFCGIGFASAASACRELVPKQSELSKYGLVVLASVQSSERVDELEWNVWRVTAQSTRVVAGQSKRMLYTFTTTLSSSGCGVTTLPSSGERWVVYLDQRHPDTVREAFPLKLVRSHDRRLKTIE
jgi:hypothetical protein